MSDPVVQLARERIAELEVDLARWHRLLAAATGEPGIPTPGLPKPTVNDIISLVADRYGITPAELLEGGRAAQSVTARHIAMRLAREITGKSYPQLGRAFRCDHTTVMYACRAVEGHAVGDLREELLGVTA